MIRADLHIHSNFSDGSDNINELYENIKTSGLKVFALTDHDTVAGCEEMSRLVDNDIKFIPSVELTCKADFVKCHTILKALEECKMALIHNKRHFREVDSVRTHTYEK